LGDPGNTRPVFTTCPHCSILVEGTCHVCLEGDEHPSCEYCVGGRYYPPPPPWYKSQLFLAVCTAVVVAVTSSLMVSRIERAMKAKKGS
jgi:hypothetical protein